MSRSEILVIESWEALNVALQDRRSNGARVVSTNGVFDILHVGHVRYLTQARSFGDVLVVGINSDRATRILKGQTRPYVTQQNRAEVLSALACVDYVTIFDALTPESWLAALCPDVHVKGEDYDAQMLPEAAVVRQVGGIILTVPFYEGYSTSSLVHQIFVSEYFGNRANRNDASPPTASDIPPQPSAEA